VGPHRRAEKRRVTHELNDMRQYLIIHLFLLSILLTGFMPIEKEFESNLNALTLYKESVGADATSTEYYFYWADGNKVKKYRFMVVELEDIVRTLADMYFDTEGKLVLYTYWNGKRKDVERLERGLGPHFLSKGKCVFRSEKMVEWYENETLRTNVPIAEWKKQEKYTLHSVTGAIDGWKEIMQKKKIVGSSSKKNNLKKTK
jgi:hypothetical protein